MVRAAGVTVVMWVRAYVQYLLRYISTAARGPWMARTKAEWLQLARARVLSVLERRLCCPMRMLEAKISEAGPGDKRPNPLSISEAVRELSGRGTVQVVPKRMANETPFYAPRGVVLMSKSFQELLAKRRHLYLLHKGLTEKDQFYGDVLEEIVDKALERSAVAKFKSRYPKQNLPAGRPLDFVVEVAGIQWGGEVKNYREWLYPQSWEIWAAISKCCELDVVPVLVTRKLPYISYRFFAKAGLVGYQTHFQFFHPAVAPELERVKAVDGLGYKDIRCVLEPDVNLINLFQATLPKIGADFRRRFEKSRDLLRHFADGEKLGDRHLNPNVRTKKFMEAWRAIVGSELSEDQQV